MLFLYGCYLYSTIFCISEPFLLAVHVVPTCSRTALYSHVVKTRLKQRRFPFSVVCLLTMSTLANAVFAKDDSDSENDPDFVPADDEPSGTVRLSFRPLVAPRVRLCA